MRRFSLLPNMITAFGLSCGLFVIYKVLLTDPNRSLFELLQSSTILILIAAFADLADGALARLIKAESDFGGQFDSLSDVVTFGVAPPLLIISSLSSYSSNRFFNFILILAAMIYTLCGVLRLVRYNIKSKGPVKEPPQLKRRRYFVGLPIPAAASIVLSLCLILFSPWSIYLPLSEIGKVSILISALIVNGFFMVSRWRFPSLAALYFRVPTFNLVLAIGIFVAALLYGIQENFALIFFGLSWGYLALSLIVALYRLLSGKTVVAESESDPIQTRDKTL
ncbi:MAG: hypothetical protein S4CHLAM45_08110 [Chlamydiales bacterium]|nr:hypothetical protein [Chlamydiales bacterium]MCH9620437.1 hypothetical protein [Chlamydiales bacterium]MCH9622917.1 hypothetical protein [Chlamydiales bacterium]